VQKQLSPWIGIAAMIGAPGLWLESSFYDQVHHQNTSIGGLFDLLYMAGWLCSIYGLIQLKAAGRKMVARWILYIQAAFLLVANVWNIWEIIEPNSTHPLFRLLDMFWPISNVWMLVTGIAVLTAGKLTGFHRYTPLIAGLWIVVTFAAFTLMGDSAVAFYIMNIYATGCQFIMGYTVFRYAQQQTVNAPQLVQSADQEEPVSLQVEYL
jgi:hypothetical protein